MYRYDLCRCAVITCEQGNSIQRHAVRDLRMTPREHICCLLHKVPSAASNPSFYEIPLEFSIKESLAGKAIIEFPALFVGRHSHLTHLNRAVMTLSDPDTPEIQKHTEAESSSTATNRRTKRSVAEVRDESDAAEGPSKATKSSTEPEEGEEFDFDTVDNDESDALAPQDCNEIVGDRSLREEGDDANDDDDDDDDDDELQLTELEFIEMLEQVERSDIETLRRLAGLADNETL